MPQPTMLDLLSSLLTNCIVVHDGSLMAVCPTDVETEARLRQLCVDGYEAGNDLLPPGLALITSAPRAAETLQLLAKKGFSLDIRVTDPKVAVELRDAIVAGVKESGQGADLFVSPQFDRRHPMGVDASRN